MVNAYSCPNCGASLRIGEAIALCTFCGTEVDVPRPSRKELEVERRQIHDQANEWRLRLERAGLRSPRDLLVPPLGCCGIYVVLFLVGSLVLATIGRSEWKEARTAVAVIAIVSAVGGAVMLFIRSEAQRRSRIAALEAERTAERARDEARLREIDELLSTAARDDA